jgi:hypothetical protein
VKKLRRRAHSASRGAIICSHAGGAACDHGSEGTAAAKATAGMLAAPLEGVDCTAYLAANASSRDPELVVVLRSTSSGAAVVAEVRYILRHPSCLDVFIPFSPTSLVQQVPTRLHAVADVSLVRRTPSRRPSPLARRPPLSSMSPSPAMPRHRSMRGGTRRRHPSLPPTPAA